MHLLKLCFQGVHSFITKFLKTFPKVKLLDKTFSRRYTIVHAITAVSCSQHSSLFPLLRCCVAKLWHNLTLALLCLDEGLYLSSCLVVLVGRSSTSGRTSSSATSNSKSGPGSAQLQSGMWMLALRTTKIYIVFWWGSTNA